jgi:hypothetical protein
MLDFVPKWLLPWIVPLAVVVVVILTTLGGNVMSLVLAVAVVWGVPLAIIWRRARHGVVDDQRQAWRMDKLLK